MPLWQLKQLSGDVHVIEVRRYPGDGGVAVIAIVATARCASVLACCGRSVVAGATGANHLGVVHRVCRRERHIVVAVLANIRGLDMWVGFLPVASVPL